MTLYEISQQIRNAIDFGYDPETGEILDDTALKELEMERDEKLENLILWVKDIRAEEEAIQNEEKALKARREANHRKGDSISQYIQNMLGGQKFSTARCAVSYRKTTAVNILDVNLIPAEYRRVKVTEEPDKTAIKNAIKAGNTIPGASLEERQSMSIK